MNSKLTLEQVNSLILFQRKYRFIKSEMDEINTQLCFYQDSLLSYSDLLQRDACRPDI